MSQTPKPSELPPPKTQLQVPVTGPLRSIVTDEEVEGAMKRQGMVYGGPTFIKDLSILGIKLSQEGIIAVSRGGAFLEQGKAAIVLDALANVADQVNKSGKATKAKIEKMTKIAHDMAYLMNAITQSRDLMIHAGGNRGPMAPPAEDDAPTRRTLGPGESSGGNQTLVKVEAGATAHIHPPAEPATAA